MSGRKNTWVRTRNLKTWLKELLSWDNWVAVPAPEWGAPTLSRWDWGIRLVYTGGRSLSWEQRQTPGEGEGTWVNFVFCPVCSGFCWGQESTEATIRPTVEDTEMGGGDSVSKRGAEADRKYWRVRGLGLDPFTMGRSRVGQGFFLYL